MDFCFDKDLKISVPDKWIQKKIDKKTPQHAFVFKRFKSDIIKELGCLKAIILNSKLKVDSISDTMAGCGFSGKIFTKYLSNNIQFNDLDDNCCKILKRNFPNNEITNFDIFKIQRFESDLLFFDFNNFTLLQFDHWSEIFFKISKAQYLMITDSACYGFKFGNLDRYQCKTELDYYQKLSDKFTDFNWFASSYSRFSNAAVILFERDKKDLRMIEPVEIKINVGLGL